MGIVFNNAVLLAKAKQEKGNFDKVLTIGHQTLFLSENEIGRLSALFNANLNPSDFINEPYADDFLKKLLGAKTVQSMDYSAYEHCDIVHDMNLPIEEAYRESYDAVIDGGSLEHIFNFPTAIKNCMEMVKTGGNLFVFTMANNHMGHGFYQFSPELFYRIFQEENGFKIKEIILEKHPYPGVELSENHTCYSVADPAEVGSRVGLVTSTPVMMMVHAIKTSSKNIFENYPIQSDYQAIYNNKNTDGSEKNVTLKAKVKSLINYLPLSYKQAIKGYLQRKAYSFGNEKFYKRWPVK